jgi:RimJ/RimL family protein N-acetyltransferase
MIKLKKYNHIYRSALMSFHLNDEDVKHTALPSKVLDLTLENPSKTAVVILKDEQPTGFFVLHSGQEISEYIDPENTLLIRALSIDSKYHRQGIGFNAMTLMDQFVKAHFQSVKKLALAVNLKNEKARNLYLKAGYSEDHRRMGPKGEQRVMVKEIY